MLHIKNLLASSLMTNCYVVWEDQGLDAMVIDPGGNFPAIRDVIDQERLNVRHIINTHGHADHIGANAQLKDYTGAPLVVGAGDAGLLVSPTGNLSMFLSGPITSPPADRLLLDNEIVVLGTHLFTVLNTPGHTPGGISLYHPGMVFSGDTLFAESVGRTDLPGGDPDALLSSIQTRLLTLPDDTTVYPGHGNPTTIGRERRYNPFL